MKYAQYDGLGQKKAFFFDLDGCVYKGHVLDVAARTLIERLRSHGKKVAFVTNNSTESSSDISKKLLLMGITATASDILCAAECTALYLRDVYGTLKTKVLGSASLLHAIESAGHTVLPYESEMTADSLIIGRDTSFNYNKLAMAVAEAKRGAMIFSTNPDMYHPGAEGNWVPETGSLVASVEGIIGRKVEYIGKPSPVMFRYALDRVKVKATDSVMIGDNLATDIAGGRASGLYTVWLNHIDSAFPYDDETLINIQPDCTVRKMQELLDIYLSVSTGL